MGWSFFLSLPLILLGAPAQAEYRVGAGDKLEISVVGVSELQRLVPVQADGTISFPLLGTLDVGGLTLPEVRARVKASLASKVYRQKSSDGSEQVIVIGLDEVTITVVEYRPIYVKGAVARPGDDVQLRTSEHRSMYSYVRLSIDRVQLRTSEHRIDVQHVRLSIVVYS